MRKIAILIAVASVCSILAYALGYEAGKRNEAIKKTDPEAWKSSIYADRPIVQDAIRRWAQKNKVSPQRAMEGRLIVWMNFPDRACVSLSLRPGSVGGVPVYCYAGDNSGAIYKQTTRLIEEYSNVE